MRKLFRVLVLMMGIMGLSSGVAFAQQSAPVEVEGLYAHRGGPMAQARPRRGRGPAAQGLANVQVMLVHATNGAPHMDPQLSRWAPHLRHLRYDNYSLLERRRARLAIDGQRSFEILGDRELTVTLMNRGPRRARLRIEMHRGGQKLVDTTVAVNRNGTFIVAGPRHGEGILVLPITVSY